MVTGNLAGLQDPSFIYWRSPTDLVRRKGKGNNSENHVSRSTSEVWSMAYDYSRKEIMWTGLHEYNVSSGSQSKFNMLIYHRNLENNAAEDDDVRWTQVQVGGT